MKNKKFINHALIGFLFGIIVWGVARGNIGLYLLIPIYLIYIFTRDSKNNS